MLTAAAPIDPVIHAWFSELTPKIQPMFADIEQWDRDALIRRFCILRAHLRDTVVRLFDIPQPPPNATSAWWRQHVANPADAGYLKLWNDPQALPTLLKETNDCAAVSTCISLLIGFFFVAKEYDGRLNAQRVSRTMRNFLDGVDTLEGTSSREAHIDLLKIIGAKREAQAVQRRVEDGRGELSAALVGIYEFIAQERVNGPHDAPDYDHLACGPLASSRCPAHESWEAVAGRLLVEDIQRCEAAYRPLLTPDIDVKAIGAAKEAERERYRESLAKKRGGPGTVEGRIGWQCDCGNIYARTVFACTTCLKEQPRPVACLSLDDEDLSIKRRLEDRCQASPLEQVMDKQQKELDRMRLENVKKNIPPAVLAAFQTVAEGSTDEYAAQQNGITARTLRNWRKKLLEGRKTLDGI